MPSAHPLLQTPPGELLAAAAPSAAALLTSFGALRACEGISARIIALTLADELELALAERERICDLRSPAPALPRHHNQLPHRAQVLLTNLLEAMLETGGGAAAANGLAWAAERAHPSRLPLSPPLTLLRDACLAYVPTRLLQHNLRAADRGLPEWFELVAVPVGDPTSSQTSALYEALATDQVHHRSSSHSWCVVRPGHLLPRLELPLACAAALPAGPGLRAEWAALPCLGAPGHTCPLSAALAPDRLAVAAVLHGEGTPFHHALNLATDALARC